MPLRITRPVPATPLPSRWRDGPTYPGVERIVGELVNTWAVSPETARVLARLVVEERRTRILEFGAGMSSRVLAAALEEIGGGRLTSVEVHPSWCEDAWEMVRRSANVDAVLIPATLELRLDRRGPHYRFVPEDEIARRGPYDLVFVDAPPRRYGRDGTLHSSGGALTNGALVVLDDARRKHEQLVLRRWLLNDEHLHLVANDGDFGRGIAVLERRPSSRPRKNRALAFVEVWGSSTYELMSTLAWRRRADHENKMRPAG